MMATIRVLGSINIDLVGSVAQHPRSGETVPGHGLQLLPGGKGANQAVAAARLGSPVQMLGKVGDDAFAPVLLSFLAQQGMDTSRIGTQEACASGAALIVVDEQGHNTIVVIPGANGHVDTNDATAVKFNPGDVAVAQFEIPLDTVATFLAHAQSSGARTVLNPAPARKCDPALLSLADVLVVNELEAEFFVGHSFDTESADAVVAAARKLRVHANQIVVITLGSRGAIAIDQSMVHVVPGRAVPVVDTTGAGDCFVGALTAGLVAGFSIDRCLALANTAASIAVQRHGAGPSMPTRAELLSEGITL